MISTSVLSADWVILIQIGFMIISLNYKDESILITSRICYIAMIWLRVKRTYNVHNIYT